MLDFTNLHNNIIKLHETEMKYNMNFKSIMDYIIRMHPLFYD